MGLRIVNAVTAYFSPKTFDLHLNVVSGPKSLMVVLVYTSETRACSWRVARLKLVAESKKKQYLIFN